jgi:integrase
MARAGSIAFQVSNIIKKHNGIGRSKLDRRNESGLKSENGQKVSDLFHSYKSLDNARNDLMNLGKFAKNEFNIKNMLLIDVKIIRSWLDQKDITYRTASNYLSEIAKVYNSLNITKDEIKTLRMELRKTLERTTNLALQTRSYKFLNLIQLNKKNQIAFELQRDYGLRVKEAIHINVTKNLHDLELSYHQKGGMLSQVTLTPFLVSNIQKQSINGIYNIPYSTYSKALQKAIEDTGEQYNGTHGIRHSFAQYQLESGKSKAEVSKLMGHTREEIINTYLR